MAAVRRAVKNVTKNFAPCERDVRDATSNDKSMASVATMVRVSNATYDVVASPMVMAMLWKRLNDIGKNWRHVYKGLLLLDYLLKTGADHIVAEVRENKFAIETLLEFRYVDPKGVDKGAYVREQAKLTLALVMDEDRLKEERVKSMQTQSRLTQSLGRKAQPQPPPASRANKFAARANVMPNGEVAPDLREKERQAVRNAQIQSFNEYATSAAGQQALLEAQIYNPPSEQTTPGGVGNANMSEEEALAYALKMSAIEAGNTASDSNYQEHLGASSSAPSNSGSQLDRDAMTAREEEELAMALSLSLAEVQGANQILNSDDESDGEPTPPSSPYHGEFFSPTGSSSLGLDQGAGEASASAGYLSVHPPTAPEFEELPSYDDSLKQLSPDAREYDSIQNETDLMAQYLASQGVDVSATLDDDSEDEL